MSCSEKNSYVQLSNFYTQRFKKMPCDERATAIAKVFKDNNWTVETLLNEPANKRSSHYLPNILNSFNLKDCTAKRCMMYAWILRNADKLSAEIKKLDNGADLQSNLQLEKEEDSLMRDRNSHIEGLKNDEHLLIVSSELMGTTEEIDKNISDDSLPDLQHVNMKEETSMENYLFMNTEVDSLIESYSCTKTEVKPIKYDLPERDDKIISPEADEQSKECLESTKKKIQKNYLLGSSYKHCILFFGEFLIESAKWSSMTDEKGKLITSLYPKIISEHFDPISKGCLLMMQTRNYNNRWHTSKIMTIYCYCGINKKTRFKLVFLRNNPSTSVLVKVYSNSLSCIHPTKIDRKIIRFKGYKTDLEVSHVESYNNIVKLIPKCGVDDVSDEPSQNTTTTEEPGSGVSDFYFGENPLIDMFHLSVETDNRYIQSVNYPLRVVMYNKAILLSAASDRLQAAQENEDFAMHIDTMGSIGPGIPPYKDKRVLYYAICYRSGGRVVPVTEYLTYDNTVTDIEMWLLQIRDFLTKEGCWPLMNRIVSNLNWTIIQAILVQWNSMSLMTYLSTCHNMICGKEVHLKPQVTVHICSLSFIKMFFNDVKSVTPQMAERRRKLFRDFLMPVLCTIMKSTLYDSIKVILQYALTVLSSSTKNAAVEQSTNMLRSLCLPIDLIVEDFEEVPDRLDISKALLDCDLCTSSPFYNDINTQISALITIIRGNVDSSCSSHSPEGNQLYSPDIASLIVNKYVPYLPLWSGVMFKLNSGYVLSKLSTNEPISDWFREVKDVVLKGRRNLLPNKFVRLMKDHLIAINSNMIV